jgi:hypothetical protein
MNKLQFVSSMRLCAYAAVVAGVGLVASCADTYDGNETFRSSVRNAQLSSPDANSITITAATDGASQTISWPVVHGASGYEVKLFNAGDESVILADTIDGCSVSVSREEDVNYRLEVRALGNAKLNNKDADQPTTKLFSTFTQTFAAIPEGDLSEWFAANPIPEDSVGMNLNFDLAPGATYTLNEVLDFGKFTVTLRTSDKNNPATIVYGQGGGLATSSGFIAKYLVFDCGASTQAVLALSENPNPDILDADHNNHHQITDPISFQNCKFNNVVRYFMYDNKKKYCVKTFNMTDCLVQFSPDDKMSTAAYFQIYDGGGFINDFIATRTTFYSTTANEVKYFIRYHNSGRCDRAGYLTNSINLRYCTFYNIAKTGQMANHDGFNGRNTSNYDIVGNIFVDCGSGQVPRRLTGRINAQAVNNFAYNTYWFDGAPEAEGYSKNEYDTSNNALQTDPAFVDAENGNFTPTGAEQLERQTGDPRWLK